MFSNVFLPGPPGHFEIEISEVLNWLSWYFWTQAQEGGTFSVILE